MWEELEAIETRCERLWQGCKLTALTSSLQKKIKTRIILFKNYIIQLYEQGREWWEGGLSWVTHESLGQVCLRQIENISLPFAACCVQLKSFLQTPLSLCTRKWWQWAFINPEPQPKPREEQQDVALTWSLFILAALFLWHKAEEQVRPFWVPSLSWQCS